MLSCLVVLWCVLIVGCLLIISGLGAVFMLMIICVSLLGGLGSVEWEGWAVLGVVYLGGVAVMGVYVSSGDSVGGTSFSSWVLAFGLLLYAMSAIFPISGVRVYFNTNVCMDIVVLGVALFGAMGVLSFLFSVNGSSSGFMRYFYLPDWNCLFQMGAGVNSLCLYFGLLMLLAWGPMTIVKHSQDLPRLICVKLGLW